MITAESAMYNLVNQFAKEIVDTISCDHVPKYEWLLQNLGQVSTPNYQERYRTYWAMRVARLRTPFYSTYFSALESARREKPTLNKVVHILSDASVSDRGARSLQFSFATKLLHMTNPRLPLYSSEVSSFFFFASPTGGFEQRLTTLMAFHDFLIREYARVLKNGLLTKAICEFRLRGKPKQFTDEKVVDSLIWAFVALLKKRALLNDQIVYG
jgi:hypothetical protein